MKVNIQSVKFDADRKLLDFIEAKAAKLDRFYDHINSLDVILKLSKDEVAGNKVAIISLDVPGDTLISEKHSKSFEESVDDCIDAIKKQLEKHKSKILI